jgi:hypothetical protein
LVFYAALTRLSDAGPEFEDVPKSAVEFFARRLRSAPTTEA